MTLAEETQPDLVTVDYISRPLGMTGEGVRKWCRRGDVPGARKVGRVWFIPRWAADEILAGEIKVGR